MAMLKEISLVTKPSLWADQVSRESTGPLPSYGLGKGNEARYVDSRLLWSYNCIVFIHFYSASHSVSLSAPDHSNCIRPSSTFEQF